MICPACGSVNLPGADRCEDCLLPFTKLDIPLPIEGLQKRLMEDTIADLKPQTRGHHFARGLRSRRRSNS